MVNDKLLFLPSVFFDDYFFPFNFFLVELILIIFPCNWRRVMIMSRWEGEDREKKEEGYNFA